MAASKRDIVLSFAGLCFLNLIASIDATALATSLVTIAVDLDATSVQAYWAGTSFVLASAACQPIFAAFSNAFGRRAMLLIAIVFFTVGTIVCGTAHSIGPMLAGRTIQGIGGGGFLTMTYVIMVDLLSLRARANGMSVIGLVWLLGTVCGPILGGGFSANVTWRWMFWICLPFAGISLFLVTLFLKTPHRRLQPLRAVKEVDWIGAILFTGCLTIFLIAISWGGSSYAWSSAATLVPLILGIVGLVAFFLYEHYVPSAPIMPTVLLANRTNLSAFTGIILMGIVYYGLLYYLPLYYQILKGYSPLTSGLALLPNCLGSGPTTAITGIIISKTGKYRRVIWFGWVLFALGCGLLVLLDEDSSIPQWLFINLVSGIGMGALFASLSVATQAASERKHMAIAAGLSPFFRATGQAIGIAIGSSVFQNTLMNNLQSASSETLRLQASTLATASERLAIIVRSFPQDSLERVELVNAVTRALHDVWWTLFAIALAGGLLSLLIRQFDLDQAEPQKQAPAPDDIEKAGEEKHSSTVAEVGPVVETNGSTSSSSDLARQGHSSDYDDGNEA